MGRADTAMTMSTIHSVGMQAAVRQELWSGYEGVAFASLTLSLTPVGDQR